MTSMIEFSTVAGRSDLGFFALAVRFETDAVDRAVHLRNADDLLDLVRQRRVLRRSIVSQPKLFACLRRSGIISPTITTAAPSK